MRSMRWLLSCTCLLLTACGWHLQGRANLPPAFATLRIETEDPYSDFYRELRRSLVDSGVKVEERPGDARAVMRVRVDTTGQRIAAVSARNTPAEYQVFYAVEYSVAVDGVEVSALDHLELTSNYSYSSAAVLAKQREQRTMQLALARELANVVLRRLSTVKVGAASGRP